MPSTQLKRHYRRGNTCVLLTLRNKCTSYYAIHETYAAFLLGHLHLVTLQERGVHPVLPPTQLMLHIKGIFWSISNNIIWTWIWISLLVNRFAAEYNFSFNDLFLLSLTIRLSIALITLQCITYSNCQKKLQNVMHHMFTEIIAHNRLDTFYRKDMSIYLPFFLAGYDTRSR